MSQSNLDVLTIGNAIVDVIAKVDEAFVQKEELVKGSMNLIDEDRAEHLYEVMGPAIEISGGSAGNTAAGVASFGGKAAYFGKVRMEKSIVMTCAQQVLHLIRPLRHQAPPPHAHLSW
jgi:sugar/nucleoside kinase (ribokinase family)